MAGAAASGEGFGDRLLKILRHRCSLSLAWFSATLQLSRSHRFGILARWREFFFTIKPVRVEGVGSIWIDAITAFARSAGIMWRGKLLVWGGSLVRTELLFEKKCAGVVVVVSDNEPSRARVGRVGDDRRIAVLVGVGDPDKPSARIARDVVSRCDLRVNAVARWVAAVVDYDLDIVD